MSNNTPAPVIGATLLPSVLRTTVPIVYAFLVKWGVVSWLAVDSALLENVIAGLVTVAFYVAVRVAERYQSQIGWLLGYAQQPVYVKGEVLNVVTEPTPVSEQTVPEPTSTTKVETTATPDESA